MNAVSLVSTTVARVITTGVLSAALFNKTVVRHTRYALKEAEQASPKLAVVTLCISTLALLHASDRIACEVLGLAETYPPATSETCPSSTAHEGCSSATARDDPRSPAFSHDDIDDFRTPLSSPSIPSPGNSLDSIMTLTSSSTVSKLGSVFGYVTPSPPAVSTRDSDGDVVPRKVCQRFFLFFGGFGHVIFFFSGQRRQYQSSALQRLALLKIFSIQSSSE
ncbi:hypothetical protein BDR04DRAFT_615079 [Suillus decipiens]|nr:hypothetical protein BDR04DRAFT_615079 [Suillus decipiens]